MPLAVTMDMHANLTATKVAHADLITAYRTNPHRDHARVGQRCGDVIGREVVHAIDGAGLERQDEHD